MLQASQRTALSGPALIRLLARLADVDVPESRQSLSDRLSQWLGWTDAIALSSALSAAPATVPAASGASTTGGGLGIGGGLRAQESEVTRVRSSLAKTITGDSVLALSGQRRITQGRPHHGLHNAAPEAPADFAVFRHRYLSIQQTMETAVGTLRGRLRAALATATPGMSRLAVIDAVMERALSERERTLLASVPGYLAGHFERLRLAHEASTASANGQSVDATVDETAVAVTHAAAEATAGAAEKASANAPAKASANASGAATAQGRNQAAGNIAAAQPGAWLEVFRKDMQSVLLAELEVRFQPVEGLLAALRAC